jgi:pSer/pThr/pTyr-binding forkhead associated (FHA) protein
VICRTCGKDNQPNYRFCQDCGSPLAVEGSPRPRVSGDARQPVRGRLVLVRPDGSDGGTHPLVEGANIIGRGSGPLFDADSFLSPIHVRIEVGTGRNEGRCIVRDAGSLNGVFLKTSEEELLQDGTYFRLGQELLRYESMRAPKLLDDGTEVMGSPNPGYWGRITVCIGRNHDGSSFPLLGDTVVLGRERGDILFPEDGYVSGTHARITHRSGQTFLQDLASSNGTFLKLQAERTVQTGTFLLLGQQLFRITLV